MRFVTAQSLRAGRGKPASGGVEWLGVERVLTLVAVTGIEQTNDAERLRESLGSGPNPAWLGVLSAVTLRTILLNARTQVGKLSTVASHPIFSRDFSRETEGSQLLLVLRRVPQEMAQFSNYYSAPTTETGDAVHGGWGYEGTSALTTVCCLTPS
jgi:hypothetical protein